MAPSADRSFAFSKMSNAQDDSAILMNQDSAGNEAFQSPNRQVVDGSAAAVALKETTHEQGLPPAIGAPLLSIEFSAQQVAQSLALDENEMGSMGEATQMDDSCEPSSACPPGTQFRLMPRKPHLIDRSPAVSARGRKRPAQSMNTTHLLRDQAPSSPLTSNLLGLRSLSLHSPRPKSTGPPQSPATSCRSFTVGSPATSFSKVAGSPSRERRSHSVDNAGDRPTDRMALSPKIVPLTVLTHSDPSKLTTPPQCPAFMSPPRSLPRQNSSLLQSPFSIGPRGPIVGTPQSSSRTLGEFSFSTPNSTLNDTPLPRISLTPRSTSSRHTRGAVPRFPSPTDLEHRPAPPLPFVVGNPNSSPLRSGANEPPHVSTENSTTLAAPAPAEVRDPPAIARSLLHCPLDNFLISRSEGCVGKNLETESLSDDDSDDFLLAFPSTIIEEKQQQMNATRQAKQPRINGLSKHVAMASTNSMSVSSLLGMAYATSDSNLHSSMSSLNYGDTVFPSAAGLKREESVASIGLTLDAPMTTATASDGRCDLVTPPPVDASATNLALGPPAIHKSRKGAGGATMLTGDDPSIRHPLSNSGLVSFSLEPKRSPPTFA